MHSRMFLGGRLYQLGLFLILVSSVLKLFMTIAILEIMLLAGLVLLLVGTLITYTNTKNINLEIVSEIDDGK